MEDTTIQAPTPAPIRGRRTSSESFRYAPDHVPDSYDPAKIPIGALFVGNSDIHELSRILGVNVTSVDDLLRSTRRLTQIKVGGVELTLEPGLIERLYSRSGGQDFTTFLNETIKSLLAGFCGW